MMNKVIGIELGSTRIKAVLIDGTGKVIAQGAFDWENSLVDGLWSYSLDEAKAGLQACYAGLNADYAAKFGEEITSVDAIGISAMMHGYLAFDEAGTLLAPFRTWRNTNTGAAVEELSPLFAFNVPMRWSVAQYYESVLEGMPHVHDVAFLTTLAGYIHYLLTGRKVLGVGDASGMFPVDAEGHYDAKMLAALNGRLAAHGVNKDFGTLLPQILLAGEDAGTLTPEGALLLDPTGRLQPGCPLCPPEGDMGTGMIATNSVAPRTANVSLGTSANFTLILEKPLKNWYPEIDVIATPDGYPAALVHTNTCTSVINTWVELFDEVIRLAGGSIGRGELFTRLFNKSAESDADVGGVVGYNYLAGEPVAHLVTGRPMLFNLPEGNLNLANFMQMQIYSAIATLALGLDILKQEDVGVDSVCGHGGFFKTPKIGQGAMSALVDAPVTVMPTAGEGGAWGIALLALYMGRTEVKLSAFLDELFASAEKTTVEATPEEKAQCAAFMKNYRAGLPAMRELTANT